MYRQKHTHTQRVYSFHSHEYVKNSICVIGRKMENCFLFITREFNFALFRDGNEICYQLSNLRNKPHASSDINLCVVRASSQNLCVCTKSRHIQPIVLSCSAGCNSASIHSTTIWQQAPSVHFEWKIHAKNNLLLNYTKSWIGAVGYFKSGTKKRTCKSPKIEIEMWDFDNL